MKQINFISSVFIFLVAISCSTNDTPADPIVGTWKPIKESGFAANGSPEVFEKTPCEQTSRFTFATNGNFTYTEFDDDEGGGCVPDESYILDGTWVKLTTGRYEFSFTYFNSNTQQSESDSQIPDKVAFSNTNTTMRIIEQEDEGESYLELVRVN
tara:strand:+ start:51162 stop:51626 length:465 start_codon:yes stop_codon:yes gene_type:complete